jgi:hypothetical protein
VSPFRASLLMTQLLHVVAALVYLELFVFEIENCDRADSLAAAWGLAVQADLLLSLVIWAISLRVNVGNRLALLGGGWTLGQVPLVLLSWPLVAHFKALPTGCGV